MARLKAGEEIDFSAPPDVGVSFDPFIRTQLRAIASALDVPYEYLSGDYSGVTFASGRHAILSYARQLSGVQDFIMVHQLLDARSPHVDSLGCGVRRVTWQSGRLREHPLDSAAAGDAGPEK